MPDVLKLGRWSLVTDKNSFNEVVGIKVSQERKGNHKS